MDETRLDAPVTPAHIFAYKALRSMFVTENTHLQTSPIVRYSIKDTHRLENTENEPPESPTANTNPALMAMSTSPKRKPSTVVDLPPDFTPKKQRLVLTSPAKSILRNASSAATPKRAGQGGRDLTVTFRDLRKSLSPEIPLIAGRKEKIPLRSATTSVVDGIKMKSGGSSTTTTTIIVSSPKKGPAAIPLIPSSSDSGEVRVPASATVSPSAIVWTKTDVDRYQAQTEKEMKRILRYGQKMRECAKAKEEENAKLGEMLEELRKENERLKRRLSEKDVGERLVDKLNTQVDMRLKQNTHLSKLLKETRNTLYEHETLQEQASLGSVPWLASEVTKTNSVPQLERANAFVMEESKEVTRPSVGKVCELDDDMNSSRLPQTILSPFIGQQFPQRSHISQQKRLSREPPRRISPVSMHKPSWQLEVAKTTVEAIPNMLNTTIDNNLARSSEDVEEEKKARARIRLDKKRRERLASMGFLNPVSSVPTVVAKPGGNVSKVGVELSDIWAGA